MLETTIQYVITIRYNFLQKYLLYFRPCICIHRFADISFAASYRRYRVVRRRIYDIVKPRYLAFGIAKGLTIYDNNDSKTIEKSKKKKKMVHRSRNNKREHNRGTNVWFGKHVANQQKHSFQVLSFDERETIGDVQSDLARGWRSDDSTKISRKGWTGRVGGERERRRRRERDKGNPERQGYIVLGRLILYSV